MSGAVVMAVAWVGCLFVIKNAAIWILRKNEEFLAKQVPKLEQLEAEFERLIELCGEEEE